MVRIDIDAPLAHGGRIPSGNEAGANPQWEPGGHLPTGIPEIVIDSAGMIPGTDYDVIGIVIGQPHATP